MNSTLGLSEQLDRLLAEPVRDAIERERCTFDVIAGPYPDKIVLFGAGGLGRRTLAGLRKAGIEPIAFMDNDSTVWGSSVDGVPVIEPRLAAQRHGSDAVFIITIWSGKSVWDKEDRMIARVRELKALGCERVASFGVLYWKYPEHLLPFYAADLPHKILGQAADIRRAFQLWADDASRREYVKQVRWRLFLDFDGLDEPVPETMYFPKDLLSLSPGEVFVDCGAYDGDTLEIFLQENGGEFGRIVALEADPANYERLKRNVATMLGTTDRAELHRVAAGARRERLSFVADGSNGARISTVATENAMEVQSVALDDLLKSPAPTFLKMDIEGSELAALAGSARIIREHSPVLAICCYHRQDDLWTIPLYIESLNPAYSFFLRPHKPDVWDLVCYAIPGDRCLAR